MIQDRAIVTVADYCSKSYVICWMVPFSTTLDGP